MKYPTLRLFDGYAHTNPQFRDDVYFLQIRLAQEGFPVVADGYFGFETAGIVERYQRAMGLVDDGIVGPKTWGALLGTGAPKSDLFDTDYAGSKVAFQYQLECAGLYRESIVEGALRAGVPVAIILGIGSRESGWGRALKPIGPAGTGDFIKRATSRPWRIDSLPPDGGGFGRGLMQIDYDAHEFARTGNWQDPHENILYGATVLRDNLRYFTDKGFGASPDLFRMAVAAYNCGAKNVRNALERGRDIDYYTHGRDYSRDVFSRAGWFQRHGWPEED